MIRKLRSFIGLFSAAVRAGALGSFLATLPYRFWGRAWAGRLGYRFHRSTMLWFVEDGSTHTRAALLLPRLKVDFEGVRAVDLEFRLFGKNGATVLRKKLESVGLEEVFVVDSRRPPEWLVFPKPFEGTLLVELTLRCPESEIAKRPGLFSATHTYIDYYSEGRFVATLHDYSAFLPDQFQRADLGMIPAYCDPAKETFVIVHSAEAGIGSRDLRVLLKNSAGETRAAALPALKPFSVRRIFVSDLFPDAAAFLDGKTGQVTIEGVFRQILTRVAYGVADRIGGGFSLDHCFYHSQALKHRLSKAGRQKIPKGHFNPFFVIDDGDLATSALLFDSAEGVDGRPVDLLIYDAQGRLVVSEAPFVQLQRDRVCRVDVRDILRKNGVAGTFTGHAELLYHASPEWESYPTDLAVCVEYVSGGKFASVIFGAGLWNPPEPSSNRNYRSINRVICDDAQTTYIAISNCCYDYDRCKEAELTLSLVARGAPAAHVRLSIPPNGTVFRAVDDLFPAAKEILAASGGAGLTLTSDINCLVLTHLFLTQDRASKAVSAEHSLDL